MPPNKDTSITVLNCNFNGNVADHNGGGVFNLDSSFPAVVDMGAYEFTSSLPHCILLLEGDINCDGIVNELDFALMARHWLETI